MDIAFLTTGVNDNKNILPQSFELLQNYPNTFNPSTNIVIRIAQAGLVNLKVYDVLGNEVAVLLSEEKVPGEYNVNFNAAGLASGVYYAKLQAGGNQITKKMLLLK